MKNFIILFCFIFFINCNNKQENLNFELQENSGIDFVNTVENNKDFNIMIYRNFYNGGGVGVGDINNDGLVDVIFTSNMGDNKLYLNQGNFKFKDITLTSKLLQQKKWATGVNLIDINADGWLDIYICYAGYQKGINNKNELYINNHDLTFTESASNYGLDEDGFTTHAAFFDYDLDGDLDVYILKNSFIPVNTLNFSNQRNLRAKDWPVKDFLKGGGDKLLKNENGKFIDVSEKANIYGSLIGFGLGVNIGDINDDGYPDIYISNDFFEKDYLYINQKNGTFKEELENYTQHISQSSMGADIADINNDGFLDIFTTDMLPSEEYKLKVTMTFDNYDVFQYKKRQGFYNQFMQNNLQLNNQNGKFYEIGLYSGVEASDWSWGALIFDIDNDGFNDIFVSNGIAHDLTNQDFMDFFANDIIKKMVLTGDKATLQEVINKMPINPVINKMYINQKNLKFIDKANINGTNQPSFSNGAAYADLDNDGDLDLLVNNLNQKSFVYKNLNNTKIKNNFIQFQLIDNLESSKNKFCIGSSITIFCKDKILKRELIPSRGFQSSVDYNLHFGLGDYKIDSIYVKWSDNTLSKINKFTLNQKNIIDKNKTEKITNNKKDTNNKNTILKDVKHNFIKHEENQFVDFYYERNIPFMLSKQGPSASVGDINKDGLDDIYISGAAFQTGHLYIQNKDGFVEKKINKIEDFKNYEETATAFFDANGDDNLDLWISHGGNEINFDSNNIAHRLYINDGKGNFILDSNKLPFSNANTSIVLPIDFDNDNDIDLFIGGRNITQNYGSDANSYILENNGKGKFKVFLNNGKNPFDKIGIITAADYKILDKSNIKKLIIVGEWMQPKIFEFKNNNWNEQDFEFQNLKGLWQSMSIVDINNDGLNDIVLGNIGENFYLQKNNLPFKLYINDFDKNNINDKILTKTINGRNMPIFFKKDITDQMPYLKKENLNYSTYAKKSIEELFATDLVNNATKKEINFLSSIVLINKGNNKFEIKKLQPEIQFSCINSILPYDINNDNRIDFFMGGNNTNIIPQFSSLDANFGSILLNKNDTTLICEHPSKTGWTETQNLRGLKIIKSKNKNYLLVLINNDYPKLLEINNK